MMLFLAFGTLWLQALVIQLSALHALRERLRAKWDALLGLERRCVGRILASECASEAASEAGTPASCLGLWTQLNGRLLPEDPAAIAVLGEAGRLVAAWLPALRADFQAEAVRLGISAQSEALFLRERNARDGFEAAVGAYERRRCALRMEGVVAWFGYKPHSTVGMTPKVG